MKARERGRLLMIVGINASDIRVKNTPKKVRSYGDSPVKNFESFTGQNGKKVPLEAIKSYYAPSFGARFSPRQKKLEDSFTSKTHEVIDRATELAKTLGHGEVGYLHVMKIICEDTLAFMNDLDSEERVYGEKPPLASIDAFEDNFSIDMFKKEKERAKAKKIIQEETKRIDELLSKQKAGSESPSSLQLSNSLYADINTIYLADQDIDAPEGVIDDAHLLRAVLWSDNEKVEKDFAHAFKMKLSKALMIDTNGDEETPRLRFYDDKARHIWKNLASNTNMFVLHEKNVKPDYLINSFTHLLSGNNENLGRFNPENTEVTVFNKHVNDDFLFNMFNAAKKDKTKNHVFVFDIDKLIMNGMDAYDVDLKSSPVGTLAEFYRKTPPNMGIVIIQDKDKYYSNSNTNHPENPFKFFGEVSVPIMSAAQAKKTFKEEKGLMKDVKKPFTQSAIDKVIETTVPLAGNYPEKAVQIMTLISSRYVDKKEITSKDVLDFVKEAKHIFKTTEDDSSVKVVFDTGKKLKDIVGPKSTRKEAQSIVRMIKDRSIGTKGYVIYSQDGSVGSGRKHMAQVVAGESKIPYLEINALDFGTKDVDLFGQGNLSPEGSIKKLFSLVKSQAETNSSKGAVLFIENFEYFSVGEQVSEYHQKAMAQLLREMDNAQKQGLNIVVMGSTSDPEYIGEATLKSFKFVDTIEIESPSRDKEARFEILEYYAKKKKLNIAGQTEEEKKAILDNAAETTKYFPYVMLLAFLDKAKNVAKERGHKAIEKMDFTEAYLQITSGRASSKQDSPHRKEMVTSHECGHGITTQVMYDFLKEEGPPWHVPDKLNFITLDPRGSFGGAMFPKDSENDEYNLEVIFTDLVVDFGGYSCEKHFYKQDGSWGITGDMEHVTTTAERAVLQMGLGPKTGKGMIPYSALGTIDASPKIRNKIDDDIEVLKQNACFVSDLIVKTYADFIKEFTDRHKHKVGTGECIIPSDEFETHLKDWKSRQSEAKLKEIENLEKAIKETMEKTKKGELAQK